MGGPAVEHGYYRFTDVFFEWVKMIPNEEDKGPLRAIISHSALVDPGHPLRKPGAEGIELYIATFLSGESRPVFSSAQLEFIQQWLYAMGLTKGPIPLPGIDWLIRREEMASLSPELFNDAAHLKKTIKTIEKNNKRLKGAGSSLITARRLKFERVRELWAAKTGSWLAIDMEAWEYDHKLVTEFGWSRVTWRDGEAVEDNAHWIVKEYRDSKVNGTYVRDRKFWYDYGDSELVPKRELKDRVAALIHESAANGPLYLVFHDASQDVKYLQSSAIEAPLGNLSSVLPDTTPTEGMFQVDTAELFSALTGDSNFRALERVCTLLKVGQLEPRMNLDNLHNAGNDAHATILCLKSMASGDSIDTQREKRWPGQTSATENKTIFSPYEDDVDEDEPEDIMREAAEAYSAL
ncbi:hypothetical protein PsYK624_002820 [Phanerochaete sordida]|uniref:Gfd2/YDR514C-like C-terminal domain-containing protein n=1 Tax=Phanerochaete sordida TaxID=48140 RepID=A0A9P3L6N0_9APHY|nr:hypothetical protein PsYK624_002820 [Phanerochaete sordida]